MLSSRAFNLRRWQSTDGSSYVRAAVNLSPQRTVRYRLTVGTILSVRSGRALHKLSATLSFNAHVIKRLKSVWRVFVYPVIESLVTAFHSRRSPREIFVKNKGRFERALLDFKANVRLSTRNIWHSYTGKNVFKPIMGRLESVYL